MYRWTVEQAMKEVKAELQAAVTPLTVDAETLQEVDDRLRPSFEAQHAAGSNADWERDRRKVLGLVRLAGSVAATLTLLDWATVATVGNGPVPEWPVEVRGNDVLAAIHLIATQICTSAGYCGEEKTRSSPATNATRQTFAELQQLLAQVNEAAVLA